MNCPNCGAAMDLRQSETFNAHWECPFDQQVVWVEKWVEDPASEGDGKSCGACGYGDELQPLQVWRDADGEGWLIHPLCAETHSITSQAP